MSLYFKRLSAGLLMLFLFTLPWQTRWIISPGAIGQGYWEYGTLSLYASDILLIIIILSQLIACYLDKKKIAISTSNLLLLVISFFVIAANIILSLDHNLSLLHAGWLVLGIGLFIILRQEIIPRTYAFLSFISGAAVVGFLGTWQFISQNTFSSVLLGLAKHGPHDVGASVIETMAPDGVVERWLRAYGSLDHPNMLGGLTALAIFFCLYLIFKEQAKSNREVIIIGAFIFLTTGLIASFSRAALIGIGLAVIIYFIYAFKTKVKGMLKKAAPLFAIGLIITILFALPYYYIFLPRVFGNTRLEQLSSTERVVGYKEALPIIKQNLVIGSGLGTFGIALQKTIPAQISWFYQPVHNIFLLVLAETGILGLLLWLWFVLKNMFASWNNFPKEGVLIFGTMIILFCLGSFDHWLMSLHFGVLFSATALGLAFRKPGSTPEPLVANDETLGSVATLTDLH